MKETLLYHYDLDTKQKSIERRHRVWPRPKFPSAKIRWKVLATNFWVQDSIFLINYLPKGQTINAKYYASLLLQMKDILKEKRRRTSPRWSCFCTTIPQLTVHLKPRRNWPTWASMSLSSTLFCGSDPLELQPVPWTEKIIEKSPFFVPCGGHSCRWNLVWKTNFWIFFNGLQNLE